MEELHKPSLIDRRGLIAPIIVQKPEFELKYHMKNGVSEDIINLNIFPFFLTHEAEFWFYHLKTHSIHTWEEIVSKFLSKYNPCSKALQLRKDILNFQQLPAESVFEAWERFKSCLRKCPDHRILLVDQILTFYTGITMIDREKIMMVAGGNIMRKTPQEAYDLIENMTLHHFQWDAEFIMTLPLHQPGPGHPHTIYYSDSDESDEDEPSEAEKSKIHPLIRGPVSEKPLDSLDPISKTFDMTITNPLFDFDYEFTLNSDNPILVIQNEESDESKTETIMEEVQIHSSQSTAQIPLSIPYDREDYRAGREFEPGYGKVLQFPPLPRQQPRRLHVDATWTHLGGDTWQPDPLTVDPLTLAMTCHAGPTYYHVAAVALSRVPAVLEDSLENCSEKPFIPELSEPSSPELP
ncbi:reverse transcriptase domain-containing protein [Tanacetum coccineum]